MTIRRKAVRLVGTGLLNVLAVTACLASSLASGASLSPSQTRISTASDKFDGVAQFAVGIQLPAPEVLRAHHSEFAFGAISSSGRNEMFVSIGPVWRLPVTARGLFVDISIAPTLISGSIFEGRDLGGNFHFTSSISMGKAFGQTNFAALRIQHTSNGGLNSTNPGMDMIGLEFSIGFSN